MRWQMQLDLPDVLSLNVQLRHQANFGVPQGNNPSVYLDLLFADLVGLG